MYAEYVFEHMMDPSIAASVSFEALIADRLELRLFQVCIIFFLSTPPFFSED